MAPKPIPEGYHTVTPYLAVRGVARLMDFVTRAFGAKPSFEPMRRADGAVMHAEMKIGDSIVMMGEPMDQKVMPAMLHVYCQDVDSVFSKAVSAGGKVLRQPEDQFYGDRTGSVEDPCGNVWYIATHKEDVPPEEMERRMAAMAG